MNPGLRRWHAVHPALHSPYSGWLTKCVSGRNLEKSIFGDPVVTPALYPELVGSHPTPPQGPEMKMEAMPHKTMVYISNSAFVLLIPQLSFHMKFYPDTRNNWSHAYAQAKVPYTKCWRVEQGLILNSGAYKQTSLSNHLQGQQEPRPLTLIESISVKWSLNNRRARLVPVSFHPRHQLLRDFCQDIFS